MKKNYAAWEIDPQEFFECTTDAERIHFLLRFAVLAPSTHNSQPWQFEIHKNEIILSLAGRVNLPIGDPELRQRYIALGCALENLLIASDYYGYVATIKTQGINDNIKITISLKSTVRVTKNDEKHLIHEIKKRATNRSHYRMEQLTPQLQTAIEKSLLPGVQVTLIKENGRKKLGDIISEATNGAMENVRSRT